MKDFVYRAAEKKGELISDEGFTRKPASEFTKEELAGVEDVLADGDVPSDVAAKLPKGLKVTKLAKGENHHSLSTGSAAQKALAARCARCKPKEEKRPVSG